MTDRFLKDEFVSSLPDDDVEAWDKICKSFYSLDLDLRRHPSSALECQFYDIYGFVMSMLEVRRLHVTVDPPTFDFKKDHAHLKAIIGEINGQASAVLQDRQKREAFGAARDSYPSLIPGGFAYEFLETDYKRIQELVDELRTLTSESKQVDPDHKRRLLKRIERLQQELHKRMSNLDMFWGLIGDAGVALGRFGTDIKPLVDRAREIIEIVARTQARAHGLPAPEKVPLLEAVDQLGKEANRVT